MNFFLFLSRVCGRSRTQVLSLFFCFNFLTFGRVLRPRFCSCGWIFFFFQQHKSGFDSFLFISDILYKWTDHHLSLKRLFSFQLSMRTKKKLLLLLLLPCLLLSELRSSSKLWVVDPLYTFLVLKKKKVQAIYNSVGRGHETTRTEKYMERERKDDNDGWRNKHTEKGNAFYLFEKKFKKRRVGRPRWWGQTAMCARRTRLWLMKRSRAQGPLHAIFHLSFSSRLESIYTRRCDDENPQSR